MFHRFKIRRSFYFLTLLASALAAKETLCGIIDIPTSLIRSKSPYYITGDIVVPIASRLTIESGVELIIASKDTCNPLDPKARAKKGKDYFFIRQLDHNDSSMISIKVNGAFFIHGTPDSPVIIRPEKKAGRVPRWDGIRIFSQDRFTTQIQYLEISGAWKAINVKKSKFSIASSIFKNNTVGINLENRANLNIYNSIFTGNFSTAIYSDQSAPNVFANIFYRNNGNGIWSDSRQAIQVQHNIFYKNTDTDCYHCPHEVGRLVKENVNADSTDELGNLFQDPIFVGTKAERIAYKKDVETNTSKTETKDSILAYLEEKARKKANSALPPKVKFKVRGPKNGKFRLSKYSPGISAAPNSEFFVNTDGSRGDIGIYGGKSERTSIRFPH